MPEAPRSVRVLGIDPGSRVTGYGVVDFAASRSRHVASGCIRTGAGSVEVRLQRIYEGVSEVVEAHAPLEVAIEKVFMHRNADSALKLGQARGAAILGGIAGGRPLFEYSPNQIKQAVTGRGHAAKEQVQHMVRLILDLPEAPASDEADALAVAICHGHIRETLTHLDRGKSTRRRAVR